MVDVKKLLDYNENVRHKYFETLTKLTWKEFTANREASFNSITQKHIRPHFNRCRLLALFPTRGNLCSKKKYDDYGTFEEIKAYMTNVEARMRARHSLGRCGSYAS